MPVVWSIRELSRLREGIFDRNLEGEALRLWLISVGVDKPKFSILGKYRTLTAPAHRTVNDSYSPKLRIKLTAQAKEALKEEILAAKKERWRTPIFRVGPLEMYQFIAKGSKS